MKNQQPNLETQKTLGSVAGQKIISTFEKSSVGKILALLGVAYALAWPESAGAVACAIFSAKSYFLAKLIFAAFVIDRWRLILKIARKAARFLRRKFRKKTGAEEIEGVPIYEILHQLFFARNFKRTEVIKKWAIPQTKFDALAKKLEALGVLIRGENNSRILNPDFSREQIAEILRGAKGSARGIQNPLRIFQFGKASKPTAAEMRERVRVAVEGEPSNDGEIRIHFGDSPAPPPDSSLDLRNP